MKKFITALCAQRKPAAYATDDWELIVPPVVYAMNSHVKQPQGISHLEYLMGHPPREVNCPIEALRDANDTHYNAIRQFKINQAVVQEVADSLAKQGREQYVARRNKERIQTTFQRAC